MIGRKFGRLRILKQASRGKWKQKRWHCICKCGQYVTVDHSNLIKGNTKSCGCLRLENLAKALRTHGHNRSGQLRSPEYQAYANAKARCTNSNNPDYQHYGGRGIEFKFTNFFQFLHALGLKPSSKYSLDRWPNNNGHYEVSNVRWATRSQQMKNCRKYTFSTRKKPIENQVI